MKKQKINTPHKTGIIFGVASILDALHDLFEKRIKNEKLKAISHYIMVCLHMIWLAVFFLTLFTGFGILHLIFFIIKGWWILAVLTAVIGYDVYRCFVEDRKQL